MLATLMSMRRVMIPEQMEADMNEEQFNLDLRKFLKRFGVSAQHAIEESVRQGLADGSLRR